MEMPWNLHSGDDIELKLHGFSSKNKQEIGWSEQDFGSKIVFTTDSYEKALNAEKEMIEKLIDKIGKCIERQKQTLKDCVKATRENIKIHKSFYDIIEIKNIQRLKKLNRLITENIDDVI